MDAQWLDMYADICGQDLDDILADGESMKAYNLWPEERWVEFRKCIGVVPKRAESLPQFRKMFDLWLRGKKHNS